MKVFLTLFLQILMFWLINIAQAQIQLDGSLGRSDALFGPIYQIRAELGQQRGGNLFHSFEDFNLARDETAIFSGPNTVQTIINRVTGGRNSQIDGILRSTIPKADLYFLNPAGILFGPHAKLEVEGSFHASTAHYLRLQEGGQFNARSIQNTILTTAPVAAFGFLDEHIAPITVMGQGEVTEKWQDQLTGLRVPATKTVSLIGGDITFKQGTFFQIISTQNAQSQSIFTDLPSLSAPFGQINVASVAQAGEVLPHPMGLDLSPSLSSTSQLGNLTLSEHTLLDVSGPGGGSIFIRAGQFLAQDSRLRSNTLGSQNGGKIDIWAHSIALLEMGRIEVYVEGEGHGTEVTLQATESITASSLKEGKIEGSVQNRAGIDAWSGFSSDNGKQIGDLGDIVLEAKDIEFKENAHIDNITYGNGQGGNVTVRASNSVVVSGIYSSQDVSGFGLMSFGEGRGGNLFIEAKTILYRGETETVVTPYGTGNGGNLTLHAQELLSLSGTGKRMGMGSRLYTANFFGQGQAGDIEVVAKDIEISDGAMLNASTFSLGNAGNIKIQATGKISVAGADQLGVISQIATKSNAENEGTVAGKGGNIEIEAGELVLKDGGQIATGAMSGQSRHSQDSGDITLRVKGTVTLSGVNPYGENATGFGAGIYATSRGLAGNAGRAGQINLQAENLIIKEGAVIKTSTNNDAEGGNLKIDIRDTLRISGDAAQIPLKPPALQQLTYLQTFSPRRYNESTSGIYATSEGILEKSGNSGNLELSAKHLIVTNRGQISTSTAGGGKAGQLKIQADQVHLENDAFIGSESQLPNTYTVANSHDRDSQILVTGDVIEVADVGNGKAEQYVYTGTQLLRINPLSTVADWAALQDFSKRYAVNLMGEVIEVQDAGEGRPARFFYKGGNWVKVKDESSVTLENVSELNQLRNMFELQRMPYTEGQAFHVKDAGDGKSADFIYLVRNLGPRNMAFPIRIKSFTVSDQIALSSLGEQKSLQNGDLAKVASSGESFVYQDQTWIKLNPARVVPTRAALHSLSLAQTGNIVQWVEEENPASFIYSGNDWLPLGQEYHVSDMAQRDQLQAQEGDVVTVAHSEVGKSRAFFYINGHWQERIHGGETGSISLQAQELRLTHSAITTEAVSAGGGSLMLNVGELTILEHSQITTSVQGGLEKGGDILIGHPNFMVLNQSQIRAQADEGQGGNIRLVAEQYIPSANSLVTASSRLGIDGQIDIDSPDIKISAGLLGLNNQLKTSHYLLKSSCGFKSWEDFINRNTFFVHFLTGSSPLPADLRSSPLLLRAQLSIRN